MQTKIKTFVRRNVVAHQDKAIHITEAGLVELDRKIAKALKQNDRARHQSMTQAAGLKITK